MSSGEMNLGRILESLAPTLLPGVFVFVSVGFGEGDDLHLLIAECYRELRPVSFVLEQEGGSFIAERGRALAFEEIAEESIPVTVQIREPMRMISLPVHSENDIHS